MSPVLSQPVRIPIQVPGKRDPVTVYGRLYKCICNSVTPQVGIDLDYRSGRLQCVSYTIYHHSYFWGGQSFIHSMIIAKLP